MPEKKQTNPMVPFVITIVLVGVVVGAGIALNRFIEIPDLAAIFKPSKWGRMHMRYHTLAGRGDYEEALEAIQEALDYAREEHGRESWQACVSLTDITECLVDLNRYDEALISGQEALRLAEVAYANSKYMIVRCMFNLGQCYFYKEDYTAAEGWFVKAVDVLDTYNADVDDETKILDWLAATYEWQGRYDEAIPLYQETLNIYGDTAVYGYRIVEARKNLATAHAYNGDLEASRQGFDEALTAARKYSGRKSQEYGGVLLDMAEVHADTGRPVSAEELYLKSIDHLKEVPGADYPSPGYAMERLAVFYVNQDRWDDALNIHVKMLEWYTERYGEMDIVVVHPHYQLGYAYLDHGDIAEAARHFQKAVDIVESSTDADVEDKRTAYLNLAKVLDRTDEAEKAALYREKAEALDGERDGQR